MNGFAYFIASDGIHGKELWKTDGTASGTAMIKDINPGAADGASGHIWNMVQSGNYIYLSATNGIDGDELWRSDGTEAGTIMVKDIYSGSLSSTPRAIKDVNGILYFYIVNQSLDFELWKTDGSNSGTVKVMQNPQGGSAGFLPGNFIFIGNTVYFTAVTGGEGRELWKLDLLSGAGIPENQLQSQVTVYPNPSNEKIFIKSNEEMKTIKCFNYLGQQVDLQFENNSTDISQLAKGFYQLNVITRDGKSITQKFSKE